MRKWHWGRNGTSVMPSRNFPLTCHPVTEAGCVCRPPHWHFCTPLLLWDAYNNPNNRETFSVCWLPVSLGNLPLNFCGLLDIHFNSSEIFFSLQRMDKEKSPSLFRIYTTWDWIWQALWGGRKSTHIPRAVLIDSVDRAPDRSVTVLLKSWCKAPPSLSLTVCPSVFSSQWEANLHPAATTQFYEGSMDATSTANKTKQNKTMLASAAHRQKLER